MPWKQLLITPEARKYAHELFGYGNAVPLTIFVNKEGKILKSQEGYGDDVDEEYSKFIAENLAPKEQ